MGGGKKVVGTAREEEAQGSPSRWARRKPTFYRQGRQLSCLMSTPRPCDAAGDGGAPPEWCCPRRFWEATKRGRRRRKPSDNGPAVLPSGQPEEKEEEGPCRPAARAPAHSEERLSFPPPQGISSFCACSLQPASAHKLE